MSLLSVRLERLARDRRGKKRGKGEVGVDSRISEVGAVATWMSDIVTDVRDDDPAKQMMEYHIQQIEKIACGEDQPPGPSRAIVETGQVRTDNDPRHDPDVHLAHDALLHLVDILHSGDIDGFGAGHGIHPGCLRFDLHAV